MNNSLEIRIQRILKIANHIDPTLELEKEKCYICHHSILHPYRTNTPRINVENGYHWICLDAKRENSYDIINELYFAKNSRSGKISKVFN